MFDSDIRCPWCGAGRQRPGRLIRARRTLGSTAGDAAYRIPPRITRSARRQRHVDALAATASDSIRRLAPQRDPARGVPVLRAVNARPIGRRPTPPGAAIYLMATLATASRRGPGAVPTRWLYQSPGPDGRGRQHRPRRDAPSADRGRKKPRRRRSRTATPVSVTRCAWCRRRTAARGCRRRVPAAGTPRPVGPRPWFVPVTGTLRRGTGAAAKNDASVAAGSGHVHGDRSLPASRPPVLAAGKRRHRKVFHDLSDANHIGATVGT